MIYDTPEKPYQLYDAGSTTYDVLDHTIKSMGIEVTTLNSAFFSKSNMTRIQLAIRKVIADKLGYKIDRQSDDQLLIIMRAVFLQHSNNVVKDEAAEVSRLNDIVVREAAPMVASGVRQYMSYLRDASSLPAPPSRATSTSVKGSKTLEITRGI
jgi:hypothetical protein